MSGTKYVTVDSCTSSPLKPKPPDPGPQEQLYHYPHPQHFPLLLGRAQECLPVPPLQPSSKISPPQRCHARVHQAVYAIHPSLPLPIPLFTFTTDDDLLKDLNLICEFVCAHLNPTIIPPVSVHFVHRNLTAEDFPSLIKFLLPETM